MVPPKHCLIIICTLALMLETAQPAGTRSVSEKCSDLRDKGLLRSSNELLPLAQECDEFANHAAEGYERLAEALEKENASEQQISEALERGVVVGLRDGEENIARRLADKLRTLRNDFPKLLHTPKEPAITSTVCIPGGTRALAQVARMPGDVPSESFAAAYVENLVRLAPAKATPYSSIYLKELHSYFQTLSALKSLGRIQGNSLEILLDPRTQSGFDQAAKVAQLLGWRMKGSPGSVALVLGRRQSEADRQPFVSALGIDEIEMKRCLEGGQLFLLKVADDQVPIVLDENFWFEKILRESRPSGGMLEAFLGDLPAARLYAAVATISAETLQCLLYKIDPTILKHQSQLLMSHSSSISVLDGQVLLPGGTRAAAAWEQLVGSSSAKPSEFLANLLTRDEGKLLAYYDALSTISEVNQRFFTNTPQRLKAFYDAFPFVDLERCERHMTFRQLAYFNELARELPVDDREKVRFPGGESVWLAVMNKAVKSKQKIREKRGIVGPLQPADEILLHLLDTHYLDEATERSQAENFLAVLRIEKHRSTPMDATMVRLLFESYPKYKALFSYFTSLPNLDESQFSQFLRATEHLEKLRGEDLNSALGEFQALIQLVILLRENEAITDARANEIFEIVCKRFTGAQEDAGFVIACLDTMRDLLSSLKCGSSAHADKALMQALGGTSSPVEFNLDGQTWTADWGSWRRNQMAEVLRLQRITSLQILMTLYERVSSLSLATKDPTNTLLEIEATLGELVEISRDEQKKLSAAERYYLIQTHPETIREIVTQLRIEFNRKGKPESISQLVSKLIREINPYVKTTLVGWIYAYYFSPLDLIVAEDPFFVRRHRFSRERRFKNSWTETDVHIGDPVLGSHLTGGLAQIAAVAGRMGLLQTTAGESGEASSAVESLAALEMAAARSLPWSALRPGSVHLVGLQLRFGREVIAEAALKLKLRTELFQSTAGLLSPQRRLKLLEAISSLDVREALKLLSSSDLYFIADCFWQKYGEAGLWPYSLARSIAREETAVDPRQVEYFGGSHYETYGCIHAHLPRLGPYENFTHLGLPDPISERLSHFMLDLADSADRAGLPLAALAILAQPAVRRFAATTKMADPDDWLTAVQDMTSVQIESLVPLLAK